MKKSLLFIFICLFITACDHGLGPLEKKDINGIGGIVSFENWPPADSVVNLKVVVFQFFPPADIVVEVSTGRAKFFPEDLNTSLPYGVDSLEYILELEPGTYEYVVVAQQYGSFLDWRAVGQYDATPQDTLPSAVTIGGDSLTTGIDIHVDFDNLPIQPF